MKKMTIILLTAVIVLVSVFNIGYVSGKFIKFKNQEETMVSIMSMGFGTDSRNQIRGSIYGHEYVATYYVDDNEIVRELSWE